MRDRSITVVVSQGQSRSPDKRQLESDIASESAKLAGVDVLVVPHLYDLAFDSETFKSLRARTGPLIVCAWLFDRATHWVLDRNAIRGRVGETLMKPATEDEDADDAAANASGANGQADDSDGKANDERVTELYPRPERPIYCLDLRDATQATEFMREIGRIVELLRASEWLGGDMSSLPVHTSANFETPRNDTYVGHTVSSLPIDAQPTPTLLGAGGITTVDEHPSRRWYPVIDFSRCTNCMECIDFCLFGVYGIDNVETILVEQPDNCRKGCPACSRVCPQNAIIFPQHKTPAIAGAPMDSSGFKIDLSKLFGAPDEGADAIEVAARERDEQLILAGRQAVGITEDLATRLTRQPNQPQDELDKLIDQLDSLEL